MLVLNRKPNEVIVITATNGERIRVMLVDIVDARGNSVPLRARLGFEAPPTVTVHREEIQREIDDDRERLAARGIETDRHGAPVR